MKIGLFFGSFNPIHMGHIGLAKQVLSSSDLDEIWLVVSPHNPLKKQDELLEESLRYEMVRQAVKSEPNIKASNVEFFMPKPSYTANTLRLLNEKYIDDRFTLIIGSDNLVVFHQWYQAEYILENFPLIVYPRGSDDKTSLCAQYPQVEWIDAPLYGISSTQIRAKIANGEDIIGLVPYEVQMFIESKDLYKI